VSNILLHNFAGWSVHSDFGGFLWCQFHCFHTGNNWNNWSCMDLW